MVRLRVKTGKDSSGMLSEVHKAQKEIRTNHAIGMRREEAAYLVAADRRDSRAMVEVVRAVMTMEEMVTGVPRVETMADRDHPMDRVPRMEETGHPVGIGHPEEIGPLVETGPLVGIGLQEEGPGQEEAASWKT